MSKYSDNQTGISFIKQEVLQEEIASQVAAFFSAFSDTSRVKIVSALCEGRLNVGQIAEQVGISESAVSHHLRTLRQLRLVKARKVGRQVYYSLDDEHILEIFQAGVQHITHV